MNIQPIPPPVNNLTFFRREFAQPNMSVSLLDSLDADNLIVLYGVGIGYRQSRDLEPIVKRHRSTIIKYLAYLQQNHFLISEIKPGTEKKRRPTLVYYLPNWLSLEDIENVACAKGIDIKALIQVRLAEPDNQLTPRPPLKNVLQVEVQDSSPKTQALESHPLDQAKKTMKNSSSFEESILVILKTLTEEIASLRQRVTRLEAGKERLPDFDPETILGLLKDTPSKNQQ